MLHLLLLIPLAAFILSATGEEASKGALKVGEALPDLNSTDELGKELKFSSFKGNSGVVLFFYPKAFTGG